MDGDVLKTCTNQAKVLKLERYLKAFLMMGWICITSVNGKGHLLALTVSRI